MPRFYDDVEASVDQALEVLGNVIVMATPLGLGKPNELINAFYRRAVANPKLSLDILTALSLERPRASSELEESFLQPFVERLFGSYEPLEYLIAMRNGTLPKNIRVSEFYIKAGSMLGVLPVQTNYISTNYTFAARDIYARGANLLVQLVRCEPSANESGSECGSECEKADDAQPQHLSLSCNTDVTLDLLPMMRQGATSEKPVLAIAQVHSDLPFMRNKAMVETGYFDHIVSHKKYNTTLFPAPNLAVSDVDFSLGFQASTLIKDGGTLQIGIGSLADAITYATLLRQKNNNVYATIAKSFPYNNSIVQQLGGTEPFKQGLYGCSEMLVNGFMHLREAGILTRKVYDDVGLQSLLNAGKITEQVTAETLRQVWQAGLVEPLLTEPNVKFLQAYGIFHSDLSFQDGAVHIGGHSNGQVLGLDLRQEAQFAALVEYALGSTLKQGVFMHGGFFLGPRDFYEILRHLPRAENEGIAMDSVRRINRIDDYPLQSIQRLHARFINTAMMVTLSGAVVSDGLESGQVISGVGGQYNFVAQAHELEGARSVICVRSTRGTGKKATSNIVFNYGHVTIPRHLRDMVVTEYGIADLRACTDGEVTKALLNISDSRFQSALLTAVIEAGKVESGYKIPPEFCNNTPEKVALMIGAWKKKSYFPAYPLGCDFTDQEQALAHSLRDLKELQDDSLKMVRASIQSLLHDADDEMAAPYLKRIGLEHPDTPKEMLLQQLLLLELEQNGYLKPL